MSVKERNSDFGFPRYYTPTIIDGPVFRWKTFDNGRVSTEVSASRNGVMVESGPYPMQGPVLDNFVKLVLLAIKVAEQLAERKAVTEIDFSP